MLNDMAWLAIGAVKLVGTLVQGLFIGAVVAAVILFDRFVRWRVRRLLAGRAPLSDEEWGATFFPARSDVASRVRQIIAAQLGIDMSRAYPSDRFIQDLRMDDLDSMASVEIVIQVEEEFGIAITDEEAQGILTVGQLVDFVASKLDAKKCLPPEEPHRLWDREMDM